MSTVETFSTNAGFCSDCGAVLPPLKEQGDIICFCCSKRFTPKVFGKSKVTYTIYFNSREVYKKNTEDEKKRKEEGDEGPLVDRKCPKCGNDKMAYATLQLRSADEGQTVFYTCTKCKYKENENS